MSALEIGRLSEKDLAKIALEEVNENPDRIVSDIQMIKEWLEKQPHLQNICKDDHFIQFFLRGSKYSIERTKEKLDFFFSVRAALPEWFGTWESKIDTCLDVINAGGLILLNGYDKKGRRVLIFNLQDIDPIKYDMAFDIINIFYFLIMEIMMDDLDQCSVTGLVSGWLTEGLTMAHVALYSNPVSVKKSATVFQDAYPIRPRAMHMLNLPSLAEAAVNLLRSCLNEKMKNRIQVGSFANFLADTGEEVLPKELGGTNGKLQDHIDHTFKLISDKRDWLKLRSGMKSDESKRQGKSKDYSEIFGMEGSFRQLNVD